MYKNTPEICTVDLTDGLNELIDLGLHVAVKTEEMSDGHDEKENGSGGEEQRGRKRSSGGKALHPKPAAPKPAAAGAPPKPPQPPKPPKPSTGERRAAAAAAALACATPHEDVDDSDDSAYAATDEDDEASGAAAGDCAASGAAAGDGAASGAAAGDGDGATEGGAVPAKTKGAKTKGAKTTRKRAKPTKEAEVRSPARAAVRAAAAADTRRAAAALTAHRRMLSGAGGRGAARFASRGHRPRALQADEGQHRRREARDPHPVLGRRHHGAAAHLGVRARCTASPHTARRPPLVALHPSPRLLLYKLPSPWRPTVCRSDARPPTGRAAPQTLPNPNPKNPPRLK